MSGFYRSLEYIGTKMNHAKDTKQSIIIADSSYDYVQKKIREAEKVWKEVQEEKVESLHFEPNEIEPIVLKNKDRDEEER